MKTALKKYLFGLFLCGALLLFVSCGSTKVSGFLDETNYREFISPQNVSSEINSQSPEIIYVTDREGFRNGDKLFFASNAQKSESIENVVFDYMQENRCKLIGGASFKDKESAFMNALNNNWTIESDLKRLCSQHNASAAIWTDVKKKVGTVTTDGYAITTYNYALKGYTTTAMSGDTYDIHQYFYTVYLLAPYSESEKATWRLGVEAQDLTADDRKTLKQNTGVLVDLVFKEYPAYVAGIVAGDIITKINETVILTMEEYQKAESALTHGSHANVTVIRNGQEKNITVAIK